MYTNLDAIRDDSGKLPSFTFPGAYTIIYITRDSLTICPDCANKPVTEYDDPPVAYGSFDEGAPIACDDCGRDIESSYGMTDGERIAGELESAEGAADVAVALDAMSLDDIRAVMSHYGIADVPEAPTDARHREIARRAGWSL
jgi:hypothetical protein